MRNYFHIFRFVPGWAFLFLVAISFDGCSHKENATCTPVINDFDTHRLFFQIKLNGQPLPNDTLKLIKLSYFNNGTKEYYPILFPDTDSLTNQGIWFENYLQDLSADSSIKTYYVEYPFNLPTDTLFIDYRSPTPASFCLIGTNPIEINGKRAVADSVTYYYQGVIPYVINKP